MHVFAAGLPRRQFAYYFIDTEDNARFRGNCSSDSDESHFSLKDLFEFRILFKREFFECGVDFSSNLSSPA